MLTIFQQIDIIIPMIEQNLQQLGLSPKEIAVYLTVLKNGKISPAHVARITKINRTTVYSLAKELISRGIITEDLGSSTQHLVALPPRDLIQLARAEERELEKKKQTIQSAVVELEKLTQSVKYSIPKITFIGEEDIDRFLRRRTPIWNESAIRNKSPYFWGFQDPTLLNYYEDWIHWYWTQPSSAGMGGKLITHQSEFEDEVSRKNYPRRSIKYWAAATDFSATTWVMGDFIVMVMTAQHPHYLVEIHDAVLAKNMRATFKGIWESIR